MAQPVRLTTKTVAILGAIAQERSYEQLIEAHPALTFQEIAKAAQEVIARLVEGKSRLDEIREKYPRAYMKWTPEEDAQLEGQLRSGDFVSKIAKGLERGRAGIRSRIVKLDLVALMHPEDRAELEAERGRYHEPRAQPAHKETVSEAPSHTASNGTASEASTSGHSGQTAAQRMGHPLARRESVDAISRA